MIKYFIKLHINLLCKVRIKNLLLNFWDKQKSLPLILLWKLFMSFFITIIIKIQNLLYLGENYIILYVRIHLFSNQKNIVIYSYDFLRSFNVKTIIFRKYEINLCIMIYI